MLTMNRAEAISVSGDEIEILAPARTDFFIDSSGGIEKGDAPFYFEKVEGDFTMRASVRPGFKKKYDAGGLFVLDSARKWIKLEFELTDLGYPSVVSVVTDGDSDDCNGESLAGRDEVHLQVARKGDRWALHYSLDGRSWRMVRYFRLKMKGAVRAGIEAQSPVGSGCHVAYRGFTIADKAVKDMRKGR
jgi:regulation of enolase protein 1 (concanavalin A-like superfamily)